MGIGWDDEVDSILGGDLVAALSYRTPAGGAMVVAVAPVGLRDRAAGTVGFTTSLGFGKKLGRIRTDPRVALAFHAREHGLATSPRYVLVHGRASVVDEPSREELARLEELATALLGPRQRGIFWDRWLREYYDVRVHIHLDVERIVTWADEACSGTPEVHGAALPEGPPEPQGVPAKGSGPRVDPERAAGRLRATAHTLIGFPGADGYPLVLPVEVGAAGADGFVLGSATPLPPGGRRAGLLGHSFRPKLVGLEARQYTGWLEVHADGEALYAPHTELGYKAPANKTLLLLLNGFLAKRGVRRARRSGS